MAVMQEKVADALVTELAVFGHLRDVAWALTEWPTITPSCAT